MDTNINHNFMPSSIMLPNGNIPEQPNFYQQQRSFPQETTTNNFTSRYNYQSQHITNNNNNNIQIKSDEDEDDDDYSGSINNSLGSINNSSTHHFNLSPPILNFDQNMESNKFNTQPVKPTLRPRNYANVPLTQPKYGTTINLLDYKWTNELHQRIFFHHLQQIFLVKNWYSYLDSKELNAQSNMPFQELVFKGIKKLDEMESSYTFEFF